MHRKKKNRRGRGIGAKTGGFDSNIADARRQWAETGKEREEGAGKERIQKEYEERRIRSSRIYDWEKIGYRPEEYIRNQAAIRLG